jgi:hypothetical protein
MTEPDHLEDATIPNDPLKDGPLIDTNRIPSANREGGLAILNAAMKKCSDAGKKAIEERG